MIDQAFILAAGRGERMKPITNSTPKPLVKIAGKTILDRIIEQVETLPQIKKIVINSYYLADVIEGHINSLKNPKITLSKETTKLETGGGLINALKFFDITKPILLINGDIIWQNDDKKESVLKSIIDNFDEKESDILLGLKQKEDFIGYDGNGDFAFEKESGNIIKSKDKSDLNYAFTGIQIIHPRILQNCPPPPFSLNYFYKAAEQNNGILKRIKGIELEGKFFHIGTAAMLKKINSTKIVI